MTFPGRFTVVVPRRVGGTPSSTKFHCRYSGESYHVSGLGVNSKTDGVKCCNLLADNGFEVVFQISVDAGDRLGAVHGDHLGRRVSCSQTRKPEMASHLGQLEWVIGFQV